MKECIQMATNPGYFTLNQLFRSCKEGFNSSTGSCLIESNLFKAAGNFDRIIEIGSFDSPLLDLFDQKQVFGQIWKHLLLLSMLSKKMVTLFDRNVKVVENINSNVSKSQLIANRINHLFFVHPPI